MSESRTDPGRSIICRQRVASSRRSGRSTLATNDSLVPTNASRLSRGGMRLNRSINSGSDQVTSSSKRVAINRCCSSGKTAGALVVSGEAASSVGATSCESVAGAERIEAERGGAIRVVGTSERSTGRAEIGDAFGRDSGSTRSGIDGVLAMGRGA